jgi:hypothetical protein
MKKTQDRNPKVKKANVQPSPSKKFNWKETKIITIHFFYNKIKKGDLLKPFCHKNNIEIQMMCFSK